MAALNPQAPEYLRISHSSIIYNFHSPPPPPPPVSTFYYTCAPWHSYYFPLLNHGSSSPFFYTTLPPPPHPHPPMPYYVLPPPDVEVYSSLGAQSPSMLLPCGDELDEAQQVDKQVVVEKIEASPKDEHYQEVEEEEVFRSKTNHFYGKRFFGRGFQGVNYSSWKRKDSHNFRYWKPKVSFNSRYLNPKRLHSSVFVASAYPSPAAATASPTESSIDIERDTTKTTAMIRNIPNKYTRQMLIELLDNHCKEENLKLEENENSSYTASEYDFVYLPIDFGSKCNKGYAFVNFTKPVGVVRLYDSLNNYKWGILNSKKVCEITYARIQGKQALVKHFEQSIFECDTDEYLPTYFKPGRNGCAFVEQFMVGKRLNPYQQ